MGRQFLFCPPAPCPSPPCNRHCHETTTVNFLRRVNPSASETLSAIYIAGYIYSSIHECKKIDAKLYKKNNYTCYFFFFFGIYPKILSFVLYASPQRTALRYAPTGRYGAEFSYTRRRQAAFFHTHRGRHSRRYVYSSIYVVMYIWIWVRG